MTTRTSPQTIVYKKIGDLEISLDVYTDDYDHEKRPAVLYIHGGGLMACDRNTSVPWWLQQKCIMNGWVFITADYRLLPTASLPDIMEDLVDAHKFIRTNLNAELEKYKISPIDIDRIAVAGTSAGGYLSLLAGNLFEPKPTVVFSEYGMLNLKEEAIRNKVESSHRASDFEDITSGDQTGGEVEADIEAVTKKRIEYYLYLKATGQYLSSLFPEIPNIVEQTKQNGVKEELKKYSPADFDTKGYPPTLLFHGEEDDLSNVNNTKLFAEKLKRDGIPLKEFYPPGVGHMIVLSSYQEEQKEFELFIEKYI
ncbi:neutral cholesterol ester hydrolase [Acrasis kona]|uniref:Neutral cholesterol ester hydrolase n=1 Tax=Acrasis kona TaxID=1008807 RepID=A0AAW2ZBJ4_9EUKA